MDLQTFDLLAGFAHELRTPLGAISGYAELLRLGAHGPVPEGQRELLGRILQNQRRMVTLLDEMSAYSTVLLGPREMETQTVALASLLLAAAHKVNAAQHERDVRVRAELDGAGERLIVTDVGLCAAVLDAVCMDGVRHADAGHEVTLSVTCDADVARVTVTSPADPLSPSTAATLFTPFRSVTRTNDPHPLALPQARAVAHQLGGDVQADSAAAHRTLVIVLPLAPAVG